MGKEAFSLWRGGEVLKIWKVVHEEIVEEEEEDHSITTTKLAIKWIEDLPEFIARNKDDPGMILTIRS